MWGVFFINEISELKSKLARCHKDGQRPMLIPEENGTAFSDQIGPTKRNGSCHLFPFSELQRSGKVWCDQSNSQSGQLPEAVPNILVWRNRNKPFHLTSDRNLRNLRHDGKPALSYFCVWRGFTECRNTKVITLVNDKGTSVTIQWTN